METWHFDAAALDRLNIHLFNVGGAAISLYTLLWMLALSLALLSFARWVRAWTVDRLLGHTHLDVGTRQAMGSIVRYAVLVVGFLSIVQAAGINLTTFNVLAGALAFGVGFGLQNLFSNFISGLIIMLDRAIRIGDRIEVGGIEGEVVQIGARRTTVVTGDRVAIIIPNQRFMTENVLNLAYFEAPVRLRIPVLVQHGPDPREVERVILQAAGSNPDVLEEPPPAVRLLGLGEKMTFELQVWNRSRLSHRDQLVSALNFAVLDALRAHQIKPA